MNWYTSIKCFISKSNSSFQYRVSVKMFGAMVKNTKRARYSSNVFKFRGHIIMDIVQSCNRFWPPMDYQSLTIYSFGSNKRKLLTINANNTCLHSRTYGCGHAKKLHIVRLNIHNHSTNCCSKLIGHNNFNSYTFFNRLKFLFGLHLVQMHWRCVKNVLKWRYPNIRGDAKVSTSKHRIFPNMNRGQTTNLNDICKYFIKIIFCLCPLLDYSRANYCVLEISLS